MQSSQTERIGRVLIRLNGGKGSGNFGHAGRPGMVGGSGSGKGSTVTDASRRTWRVGDELRITRDGKSYTGSLQHKDGQWYLLRDKDEGGLMEISPREIMTSETIKTIGEIKKEQVRKELEAQGIVTKTPAQRRTKRQKEELAKLESTFKLSDKDKEWLHKKADEDVIATINKVAEDAQKLGLDLSKVSIERMRTGNRTLATAGCRGNGNSVLNFQNKMLTGDPVQLREFTKSSNGFHTNDSVEGTVRHEMGHIISYVSANKSNPQVASYVAHSNAATYCSNIVKKALGASDNVSSIRQFKSLPDTEMSRYGKTNAMEAIAEAWSNPNYSKTTKAIYDLLVADLGKTNNSMNNMQNEQTENAKGYNDLIMLCTGYELDEEIDLSEDEDKTDEAKPEKNSQEEKMVKLHHKERINSVLLDLDK